MTLCKRSILKRFQAGAEAVVHMVQLALLQNPHNDILSADATKAFYYLNRDLLLKKLFEEAPLVFNLFLGKYKGDTDAFYSLMVFGVLRKRKVVARELLRWVLHMN